MINKYKYRAYILIFLIKILIKIRSYLVLLCSHHTLFIYGMHIFVYGGTIYDPHIFLVKIAILPKNAPFYKRGNITNFRYFPTYCFLLRNHIFLLPNTNFCSQTAIFGDKMQILMTTFFRVGSYGGHL